MAGAFPILGCLTVVAAMAPLVGCSRPPDAAYTLRSAAERLELPQNQARQIAAYLAMFHGTPADPRMAAVDATAVEQAAKARAAAARADEPVAGRPAPGGAVAGVYPIAGGEQPGFDRPRLQLGRQRYAERCASCHGVTGDGRGPAGRHLDPPPRDYRNGVFKFTSTPRGSKPRREDLRRIPPGCVKQATLPGFRVLPEDEAEAVIDYVQLLASRGELELALVREAETELDEEDDLDPEVVAEYATEIAASWQRAEEELVQPITVNPPRTDETVRAGAVAFAEFACARCHGPDARGSRAADVGRDIWGRTAHPASLALGVLQGGRRPVDIYRRIYSGINGTPMPAAKDPDTASGETAAERSDRIWHLVHFVTAVIEGGRVPPDCQEAIYDVLQKQAEPKPSL